MASSLDRQDSLAAESVCRPAWGLRDIIRAGLAAVGLVFVASAVLIGGMAAWRRIGPAPIPQGIIPMAILFLEVLIVLPAWWWGPGKYGGGWARLGFRPTQLAKSGFWFVMCLAAIFAVNYAWEMVRRESDWASQPNYLPYFGGGARGLNLALLVGGLVAPAAEEVFFRGFLYAGLREHLGAIRAALLSALIFSLVHVAPPVLVPIFFMGLVFSVLYEKTDSVWPCIALHGLVNSLAFAAAYTVAKAPGLADGF